MMTPRSMRPVQRHGLGRSTSHRLATSLHRQAALAAGSAASCRRQPTMKRLQRLSTRRRPPPPSPAPQVRLNLSANSYLRTTISACRLRKRISSGHKPSGRNPTGQNLSRTKSPSSRTKSLRYMSFRWILCGAFVRGYGQKQA